MREFTIAAVGGILMLAGIGLLDTKGVEERAYEVNKYKPIRITTPELGDSYSSISILSDLEGRITQVKCSLTDSLHHIAKDQNLFAVLNHQLPDYIRKQLSSSARMMTFSIDFQDGGFRQYRGRYALLKTLDQPTFRGALPGDDPWHIGWSPNKDFKNLISNAYTACEMSRSRY